MMKARENPFATGRIERQLQFVPEWSELSWDEIDRRLARHAYRCAIIGDHGTGKTTLLDALSDRFSDHGGDVLRLFFNDERPPRWPRILALRARITPDSMVLCDGGEMLGFLQWRALRCVARRAGGLIVTAHDRAMLPVAIRLESSPLLVAKLLRKVDPSGAWEPHAASLLEEHRGNIRSVFRACYLALADSGNTG